MDRELLLLVRGTIIGFMSAFVLELVKHRLERRRSANLAAQASKKKEAEKLEQFLSGEAATSASQTPYPAWLRQVTEAKRNPLARLGLRSDEDYSTAVYRLGRDGGRSLPGTTLLKTFGRQAKAGQPLKRRGKKFLLGPWHLIGRGSKCDIQVLDPAVSLIHALIRFEAEQFVLYDLGSSCGTLVNEDPVGEMGVPLQGGELIVMGQTTFEFGRVNKAGEIDQLDPFLIV